MVVVINSGLIILMIKSWLQTAFDQMQEVFSFISMRVVSVVQIVEMMAEFLRQNLDDGVLVGVVQPVLVQVDAAVAVRVSPCGSWH